MQIPIPVRIEYQGRVVNTTALHDTGAETFAFIDQSIARKLGLPQGSAQGYSGIAGSSVGFKSKVDRITVTTAPNCSLAPVNVIVGNVDIPNVELLVGEYFMRSVGMVTETNEKQVVISCKGGPKVAISVPIQREYIILGGLAVLLVGAWFLFRD